MNILNPGGDMMSNQTSPQNKQITKVIPGHVDNPKPLAMSLNGAMHLDSDVSTRNDTYNSRGLNPVSLSMHDYQPEDNSFAQYRQ